jgi:NADPH-dependent 2,4-dienoyl-CoA reductase/sulfur reductase-like enzyme
MSGRLKYMRITEHPVLTFERGERITFFYNGKEVDAYPTETIAAALHAAGVRKFGESTELHRPRGLFCAIGNCSSCFMVVDGQPNMRVCVIKVKPGMKVEEQLGKGKICSLEMLK